MTIATVALDSPAARLRAALGAQPLLGFSTADWGSDGTGGGNGGKAGAKSAFVGFNNQYTVTNSNDSGAGSLRAALAQATTDTPSNNIQDLIIFAPSLAGATITLASSLSATNVDIYGANLGITISGNNAVTDFVVAGGASGVVIQNLTIANGQGTGTSGASGTSPSSNGTAGGDAAGGVFVQSGALTLSNDTFANDTATGGFGGFGYKGSGGGGFSSNGGPGGNAAGAVYVEPGATANAQTVIAYNDTATAGSGGIGLGNGSSGTASPVSNNATVVSNSAPCYCTGTMILTAAGEVAVEALAIGTIVVTASGVHRPIRWIGRRGYAGRFANTNPDALPICFKASSLADGVPARDLWVSPKHAMFLDGALVPAEFLVNGISVVKAERIESVTYWHIELDSHDVLLAEGAPSESFVDDRSRGMFINAHEFAALYPEAAAAKANYCAPRLEDGYQLEAVREAIAARAGVGAGRPDLGALHGTVEAVEAGMVRGWAQNAQYPAAPVCLDLVVDGRVVAQVVANRARVDAGPHGFEARLPRGATATSVEVRRSADGARLTDRLARAA